MNARFPIPAASARGRSVIASVAVLAALSLTALSPAVPSACAADVASGTNVRSLVGSLFAVTDHDLSLADQAASATADRAGFERAMEFKGIRPIAAPPRPISLRFDRVRAGEPVTPGTPRVDLFPHSRVAVPMLVAFLPDQNPAMSAASPRPLVGPSVGMRTPQLRMGSFGGR